MTWETVIGLEVHAQLNTQSKLFSSTATSFGAQPNQHACIIDLGLPGTLPVVNQKAVELAIRFGLSISANIAEQSVFERKNYFYPDLPKGYQISQLEQPIVSGGYLDITTSTNTHKRIRINRAHLEEDAGKSLHEGWSGETGLDYNRAGTPLLEIVTEPDFSNAEEAIAYLKTLHQLVRYLGVCDGNMQEGSFRCDVNLSVRRPGQALGTRTEIKNLNSFRFIEQAILFERDRQIDTLERGLTIRQETRLFDADKNITRTMRSKEEANDYRYFPDPDLLPVAVSQATIDTIHAELPELPDAKYQRYRDTLALSQQNARQLVQQLETADYFERTLAAMQQPNATLVANWINGELTAQCYREKLSIIDCPIQSDRLAELLQAIQAGDISNTLAREVQQQLWTDPKSHARQIIAAQGLSQINDTDELSTLIEQIINEFPDQTHEFRAGKEKLLAFFVGQVMKRTQGKANPTTVNRLLRLQLQTNG